MISRQLKQVATAALLACSLGFAGVATAATSLGTGSDEYLGYYTPPEPADATSEASYINALLGIAPVVGLTTVPSGNDCSPLATCPAAVATGAVKVDGVGDQPPSFATLDVTNFLYLIGKYDGPNGGGLVWFVGDIDGFVTIPTNWGPIPTGTQYGLSHWTLFNVTECCDIPTTKVPEPGSLALLGLGLSGLALVRRRRRD